MALTIAVSWLSVIADSKVGVLPTYLSASLPPGGKVGLVLQALAHLDDCFVLPKIPEATWRWLWLDVGAP